MSFIVDTPIAPIILNINSKNFTSKLSSSTYFYEFNDYVNEYSNIQFLISLKDFQFCNSIYNVNVSNNTFSYCFTNLITIQKQLPVGNYNIDEVINLLNQLCADDLIFTFNETNLLVTIASLKTEFKILQAFSIIGFDLDMTLSTLKTGQYIINLNTNTSLNIVLENINLNSISLKNSVKHNVLSNIPILATFGEMQYYTDNTVHFCDNFNTIILSILNQDFEEVDFNNIHWYANIVVRFIYKKDQIIPQNIFNETTQAFNRLRTELLEYERNKLIGNFNK